MPGDNTPGRGDDTRVRRLSDVPPDHSGGPIVTHELLGVATGARIGAGVTYWKDVEYSYSLWYDEIVFCYELNGSLEIVIDGDAQQLTPGDMMWLPNGTPVTYRVTGEATVLYAVTPTDWAAHTPAEHPKSR